MIARIEREGATARERDDRVGSDRDRADPYRSTKRGREAVGWPGPRAKFCERVRVNCENQTVAVRRRLRRLEAAL